MKFYLEKAVQHEGLLQAILEVAQECGYRVKYKEVFDGGRRGRYLYQMPCRFLYTEINVFGTLGIRIARFRIPVQDGRKGLTRTLDYNRFDLSYELLRKAKERLKT